MISGAGRIPLGHIIDDRSQRAIEPVFAIRRSSDIAARPRNV